MSEDASGALGLVAGRGAFPLALARAARRDGRRVVAIAFHGLTAPELASEVQALTWLKPGEVAAAIEALRSAGVNEAVMAGKVPKAVLYAHPAELGLDARANELLRDLPDRRDGSILDALSLVLEGCGIRLLPQLALVPELVPGEGPLGRVEPTADQAADLAFGWPLAKAVAGLDVGQTVVVKDRAVLAVEAIEGTDAAIRRGGSVAAGACVVKVARPDQDPRFDVPAIGPATVAALADAGAAALAFEAGATLVLEAETAVREADRRGIALVGMRG